MSTNIQPNRYQVQFEKDKGNLKAFLEGRNYFTALKCMGWLERQTVGKFRKDGVMPEMHHMVRLCHSAIQLGLPSKVEPHPLMDPNVRYLSLEEKLICTLLLHDAIEDDETYEIDESTIRKLATGAVATPVMLMTKKFRGKKVDKMEYIIKMALDLLAALGKGVDRNDNLEHMIGTFTLEKIISYTDEAEREHLPMLKKASKNFPEHTREFKIVMYRMKQNIRFLRQYIEAASKAEDVSKVAALEDSVADLTTERDMRVSELESAYRANQILVDEVACMKEKLGKMKAEPGSYTGMEVLKKVMEVFGDVSPQHKYVLQNKLCREFGISHLEFIALHDPTQPDPTGATIVQKTVPGTRPGYLGR